MSTSTRQQLAEAIAEAATAAPTASRDEAVDAILDALAARPRTLREFADQQGPPPLPARWPAGTDPAAWLRGACSSGDPLHAAVTAVLNDLALQRDRAVLGEDLARRVLDVARDHAQIAESYQTVDGGARTDGWLAACERLAAAHDGFAAALRDLVETPVDVDDLRPRVWQDGDDVPAGTWVLDKFDVVDQIDYHASAGAPVRYTGDPVVEVVLPDYAAEVARAVAEAVQAR